MRTSETTGLLDAKIALVQGEIAHVTKDKEVKVDGEKANWKSGYATLVAIDNAARPALRSHGVTVYQGGDFVQGLGPVLVTRLAFEGQWIESFYPIKAQGDGAQKLGGGISFARRWGLCGMLNIIASDAEEAQGYTDAKREAKGAKRGPAPTGIAQALDDIRGAGSVAALADIAHRARGAFPTGEAAKAVEEAIATWCIAALNACADGAELLALRDGMRAVKPRGAEVMAALRNAEARTKGGAS